MGRNNQQRRKAKAKARAKGRARAREQGQGTAFGADGADSAPFGTPPGAGLPPRDPVETVMLLLHRSRRLRAEQQIDRAEDAEAELAVLLRAAAVQRGLAARLLATLDQEVEWAWQHGWEPADLVRFGRRGLPSAGLSLLADVLAASIGRYALATVSPRWREQLAAAEADVWWPRESDPIRSRIARGEDAMQVLVAALDLLDLLATLPPLPAIEAPPGRWHEPARRKGPAPDQRLLERVRQLLAQAESTPYEAEAETFTAAAQSLMARHSIDAALLAATGPVGSADQPGARRVGIDRPYEAPKVALLDAVARANRSRTIWSKELGFVTVIGFATDLDMVETLFTSLLVQATTALTAHGRATTASGRSRTRSFRQSFLLAYATRIGARLAEATQSATDDAEDELAGDGSRRGGALVRVLDQRDHEVDAAMSAMFPETTSHPMGRAYDYEGWAAGDRAASAATLFSDRALAPGAAAGRA